MRKGAEKAESEVRMGMRKRMNCDDAAYMRASAVRGVLMVLLSVVLVLGGTPAGAWVALAAEGADAAAGQAEGDATGGDAGGADSGDAGGGTTDPGGDAGGDSSPETIQVSELVLQWAAEYGNDTKQFVGEGWDIPSITVTSKGQLVQLNGWYLDNTGSGELLQTASGDTQLGAFALNFTSSDPSVATVDLTSGLVTPKGNGTVTITASVAKPEKYGEATTSIEITFDGQEGEYVSSVDIFGEDGTLLEGVDDDGNAVSELLELTSNSDGVLRCQLYARVHWIDADGNEVRVEDTRDGGVSTTLRWETAGNNAVVAINEKSGLVSTQKRGTGAVRVVVAGGLGGDNVTATLRLRVETKQDPAGIPAESLTLRVVYDDYPDAEVNAKTFTPEDLAAQLTSYDYLYTVISGTTTSGKGFATVRASGYLFKDVLGLMGVDLDDISQLSFLTTDDYPEPVSHEYLFGSKRYYWPDYDQGITAGGEVVPPLLAVSSYWTWDALADPNGEMTEEDRFQLVFGAKDTNDANSKKQIKYIYGITIHMSGAPPTPAPTPDDGGGDGDGDGGSGGNGSGSGGSGGTGGGDGGSGSGSGGSVGAASGNATSGAVGSSSASNASGSASQAAATATASSSGSGGSGSGNGQWRIYQMMAKSKSNPGELDLENPFAPYALPAGCAVFALGCAQSFASYRRRLFA